MSVPDVGLQNTQPFSNDYERSLPKHYRLIEMAGRGGMAEVFLAEDERLSRRVAIKFLNSEFRRDPERMRRFNQEARAASALNHPNILIIHDIGENEGVQYIVSEYIEGKTLNAKIAPGPLPLAEAVDIAIQIASALAASHKAGIVHRDIKPDNIMVRADGSVKVLDFGLAKEAGRSPDAGADIDANTLDRVFTSPGLILGTPQYMSPEQARGLRLDGRTDIFSLGIIFFEMVTGRSPFAGVTIADVIAAIVGKKQPRLEELLENPPLSLIEITERSLQKDRDERYRTMEQMLTDLIALQRELAEPAARERDTRGTEARTTAHNKIDTLPGDSSSIWRPLLVLALLAAGGLGWWYFAAGQKAVPAARGSMRSVGITTWSSGTGESAAAASFSPNSSMVAYAATRTGATEIWVQPTVGGDSVQVTRNGFYNQYPIWSPNGQELAFFSNRGGSSGIWRAAFTGGQEREITGGLRPTARPVYWAKSGNIYYQERYELFAVDERSGTKKTVTGFEARGLSPRSIEISPDETRIAYSIKEGTLWKVKIERLDAPGDPAEAAVSENQITHLAWHPDSRGLVASCSVDGVFQIFEADEDGKPVQISNGSSDFFVQDVSSEGSILYGSVAEASDIWAVGLDDPKETLVADDVAAEFWPDVSPDGGSVVFQSVKQPERPFGGSLTVKALSGAAPPVMVSSSGFSPAWSPDGKWIAFFRRSETGAGYGVWRVRPMGDEALKLAEGSVSPPRYTVMPYLKLGINHLRWSPDSRSLAFSSDEGGASNIWLARVDGAPPERLTGNDDKGQFYSSPIWARGGAIVCMSESAMSVAPGDRRHRVWIFEPGNSQGRMLFESKDPFLLLGADGDGENVVVAQRAGPEEATPVAASTHLSLISIRSTEVVKVNTLTNAYFHNVNLSPDGRSAAFASRRDNETALWTVPVNGGSPRKLLVENDPKVMISSIVWSPGGRSILYGKQTRTNLLSMLTN